MRTTVVALACLLCVERAERARVAATHSHHHPRTHSHTLTHGHHRRHCRTTHTRTHNEPHMCATVYNSLGGAPSDTTATTAVLECVWLHSDQHIHNSLRVGAAAMALRTEPHRHHRRCIDTILSLECISLPFRECTLPM